MFISNIENIDLLKCRNPVLPRDCLVVSTAFLLFSESASYYPVINMSFSRLIGSASRQLQVIACLKRCVMVASIWQS